MYIKNRNCNENAQKEILKESKKTCDIAIQTESIYMDRILDGIHAEEKLENLDVIFEENYAVIQEVENLDSPSSEHSEPENMSVIELKNLAKLQNIKGYSRMKKSELIEILSL